MAHLDTAYKLGAIQAQVDFEDEINKLAQQPVQSPPRKPGTAPVQETPEGHMPEKGGTNAPVAYPPKPVR